MHLSPTDLIIGFIIGLVTGVFIGSALVKRGLARAAAATLPPRTDMGSGQGKPK